MFLCVCGFLSEENATKGVMITGTSPDGLQKVEGVVRDFEF